MGCLNCGMLRVWDVQDERCLRCGMFECGIFGMYDFWNMEFLGCGMFRIWDVYDVGCSNCGISGMCNLWSLGCWLRKPVFENIAYQKNIRNSLKFYSDLSQNFIDNLKLDRSNQSYILRIFEQRGKSFKFCLTKW